MVKDPPSACTAKCCRCSGSKSLAGQVDAAGIGATAGAALGRMHMPGTPQDRGNGTTPLDLWSPGSCSCATNSDLLPQFEPGPVSERENAASRWGCKRLRPEGKSAGGVRSRAALDA